jgi:hypothetical protein
VAINITLIIITISIQVYRFDIISVGFCSDLFTDQIGEWGRYYPLLHSQHRNSSHPVPKSHWDIVCKNTGGENVLSYHALLSCTRDITRWHVDLVIAPVTSLVDSYTR